MGVVDTTSPIQSQINNLVNTKASQADVNLLNTRVNNIIANAGDDNTEIVDARVGADGTQYTILKNRLDTEHTQLKNAIGAEINPTWTSGGYINTNGTVSGNSNFSYTDYIPLDGGGMAKTLAYDVWLIGSTAVAIYDEAKQLISTIVGSGSSINDAVEVSGTITRSQGAYVRVSCRTTKVTDAKVYYANVSGNSIFSVVNENVADKTLTHGKLAFTRRNPETNMIEGYTLGYISASTGKVVSSTSLYHTDYIPLTPGKTYASWGLSAQYGAYYNANKEFVSAPTITNRMFTVPEGTGIAYGRFSFNNLTYAQSGYIFTRATRPKDYREELYSDEFDIIADGTVTVPKLGYTKHDPFTDLIDHTMDEYGYRINDSGAKTTGTGFTVSDYVELEPGVTYYVRNVFGAYCAFYDEDYAYVSTLGGVSISRQAFTLPEGAKYIRVSGSTAEGFTISTESGVPSPYALMQTDVRYMASRPTEYDGDDIGLFNKIICIGDSLTAGAFNNDQDVHLIETKGLIYNWPRQLGKLTGCDITNISAGGITTPGWWTQYGNTDFSGYDCAIIQLGVNDVAEYGGFTDAVATAYGNIINAMKTASKGIKIFVSNILRAASYGTSAGAASYNEDLADYIATLDDPDVVLLDMNTYGHIAESMAYNCGHLSAYGYWRVARDYKAYISWYMHKNKDKFRFVQFIGTDCTYTG